MSQSDDISRWLAPLKEGDAEAARIIWQAYFERLVRFARRRLGDNPRRAVDEEDVALSAINSFCRAAAENRFPVLNNRDDLWKILVTITVRKVFATRERAMAQKRGGGEVRGESVFRKLEESGPAGLDQALVDEVTPEVVCSMADTCHKLMDSLEDDMLRAIALYRLEGYTNAEIAELLECTERTVERKLARIRKLWCAAFPEEEFPES